MLTLIATAVLSFAANQELERFRLREDLTKPNLCMFSGSLGIGLLVLRRISSDPP